ncbi:MAG: Crp/Fnr family transcriptional regulator [Spirochaetes bacterium]|nr:Crp/Fnr family transcriptional regulator [Spirochaetota bacterium]
MDERNSYLLQMRAELLRYCDIPDEELRRNAGMMQLLRVEKNRYFIDIGEVPDKMGFIISGLFRVFYITEDGIDRTLVFREKNHFLSAFSAFLEGTPSWYAIQAIEESVLLCLTLQDYNRMMEHNSCWNTFVRKYVEELFIEKEKRERGFLSEDAATRYLTFLSSYPGFEERIPQHYIASYLGITPVALSRIRKKLGKI